VPDDGEATKMGLDPAGQPLSAQVLLVEDMPEMGLIVQALCQESGA